jgi:hypothetical protein
LHDDPPSHSVNVNVNVNVNSRASADVAMAELVLPFRPEAEAELFEALDFYDELDLLQDTRLAVPALN